MYTKDKNIYKTSREKAGLSQEVAAELLNVHNRTLSAYENDGYKGGVPDGIVVDMIKIYEDRFLGYLHLRKRAVGALLLPDITEIDLAKSVLKMQKEIKDVQDINSTIVNIACDGRVDNTEQQTWNEAGKEVFEMAGAALAVVFSR